MKLLLSLTFILLPLAFCSFFEQNTQDCSAYSNPVGDCPNNCGRCFNPSGRSGQLCPDKQQTGYYCPDENNFACLDWAFGSKSLKKAEGKFNTNNKDNVYFGVGTYGDNEDVMRGLGACFRMKVNGMDKDLIVQSINTGSDVAGKQFDLMQGDGGAGAYNWCAGSDFSLYPGTTDQWGKIYGGWDTVEGCKSLPEYPKRKSAQYDYDNLIELCEYSFQKKTRGSKGENPTILDLARIECPQELYEFTQIKRKDDPKGFSWSQGKRPAGFPNADHQCAGQDLSYCMTRMMDCRKPSGAFKDNIVESLVSEGLKLVQVCGNDGYTRLDNKCGCFGCYC